MVVAYLVDIVDPVTRGDLERVLLWVSTSLDKFTAELREIGHKIRPYG